MKTDSVSSAGRSTLQRYSNENDLPLYLNAKDISRLLGISQTNVYYLFRSDGFPIIIIGKRRLVKREVLLCLVGVQGSQRLAAKDLFQQRKAHCLIIHHKDLDLQKAMS